MARAFAGMPPVQDLTADTARRLARRIVAERRRTVLLDGPSGSGKSTFARSLLAELLAVSGAPSVELVRMDDLFPGWSGLDSAARATAQDLVRAHALGLPARWRPWNWATGTTAGRRRVSASLLLLEGCGAANAAARRYAGLVIWLEAGDAQRRKRALTRDGELFAPHWEEWERDFRAYCARERPREGADVVLDTSGVDD